ncbi:MAG TPA: hypothetical protein PLK06_03200 [bacterium]|nr:hypothetical protein [bacterium]
MIGQYPHPNGKLALEVDVNTDILAFTTIKEGNPRDPVSKTRAAVALDTVKNLQTQNITCVVIFTECAEAYLQQLQSFGAIIVPETQHGMSNSRREALQKAMQYADSNTHLLWLEPEKPDLPRYAKNLRRAMIEANARIGLFNRTPLSMLSYPVEQSHYYQFCRAVASAFAGFDIDYAFGPMMLHVEATSDFLNYKSQYGDLWDAILVPRIPFLKRGEVVVMDADFLNDARMTAIESGSTAMILKRLQQFNNVIPSLINGWQER